MKVLFWTKWWQTYKKSMCRNEITDSKITPTLTYDSVLSKVATTVFLNMTVSAFVGQVTLSKHYIFSIPQYVFIENLYFTCNSS